MKCVKNLLTVLDKWNNLAKEKLVFAQLVNDIFYILRQNYIIFERVKRDQ